MEDSSSSQRRRRGVPRVPRQSQRSAGPGCGAKVAARDDPPQATCTPGFMARSARAQRCERLVELRESRGLPGMLDESDENSLLWFTKPAEPELFDSEARSMWPMLVGGVLGRNGTGNSAWGSASSCLASRGVSHNWPSTTTPCGAGAWTTTGDTRRIGARSIGGPAATWTTGANDGGGAATQPAPTQGVGHGAITGTRGGDGDLVGEGARNAGTGRATAPQGSATGAIGSAAAGTAVTGTAGAGAATNNMAAGATATESARAFMEAHQT
mmetsp:Transcript_41533/g.114391  ORF Transcript_41533/g.114391 Transcript_41533/m.114391 type:complete len:270 (-) Transcript_41533:23-832(-)